MAGLLENLVRVEEFLGDIEGPITGLSNGKLSVSREGDKLVFWAEGAEDVIINKKDVQSLVLISANVTIKDISKDMGKNCQIDIYQLTLKNGQTGTLRLISTTAAKALEILK